MRFRRKYRETYDGNKEIKVDSNSLSIRQIAILNGSDKSNKVDIPENEVRRIALAIQNKSELMVSSIISAQAKRLNVEKKELTDSISEYIYLHKDEFNIEEYKKEPEIQPETEEIPEEPENSEKFYEEPEKMDMIEDRKMDKNEMLKKAYINTQVTKSELHSAFAVFSRTKGEQEMSQSPKMQNQDQYEYVTSSTHEDGGR